MAAQDPAPEAAARQRNARGEGVRLREHLLEATVALLDAEGDSARVSVRAIARAAGVSPTALYLHFPDRDALVDAAVDRGFDAFNAAILSAAAAHEDATDRLRAMGLAYLDFAERQPALYAVIFSTRRPMRRATAPAAGEPPPVLRDEGLDRLAAVVAAVTGAGEAEARELALTLWAALHGYATLSKARPMPGWMGAEAYLDRLLHAHLED